MFPGVITSRMTLELGKSGTWGGVTNLSQLLNNLSSEGLSPADLCEPSEHCGADVKVNHKLQNCYLLPFYTCRLDSQVLSENKFPIHTIQTDFSFRVATFLKSRENLPFP